VALVTAVISMGMQWSKSQAYALMLLAKKKAKDGILASGAEQEKFVVDALYILLQKLKIPFITKENLQLWVHKLYLKAMDYIDDGKFNNSVQ
jgi:hypothetical protein